MRKDIKAKAIAAVGWSSADAVCRQGIQFVISVILARLLAPEEFGAIVVVALFGTVASVFIDSGFTAALIQRREVSRADTSSVFFFNLAMGAVVGLVLCGAAPWIALYFRIPVLAPLTRLMALNVVITTFGTVQSALLSRDLDFRTQMRITVWASLGSGALAIALAWSGFGVWSLATQNLAATVISTALLWTLRPWRPALVFELAALRSLARFGGCLFAAGLADVVYNRLQAIIIGRFYSARDLGLFSRADMFQQIPSQTLSTTVSRVTYPVFSSLAERPAVVQHALRQSITAVMLVNTPVMLGLMTVAPSLVWVLLGSQWLPCVPYLQVLCLSGLLWPLHAANLNILKSMGRSDLYLRVDVARKVLGLTALVGAATVSVLAMAWSRVVLSVVCFGLNAYYTGVLLSYTPVRQVRDVFPSLVAGLLMAAAVWGAGLLFPLRPVALLALQGLGGAALYVGLCILFRVPAFHDLLRDTKTWVAVRRASTV